MPDDVLMLVRLLLVLLLMGGCHRSVATEPNPVGAANNSPEQNKEIARYLIRTEYARWHNASQLQCLDSLWQAESHWNHRAVNKRSGACGIPQSKPCGKMARWGEEYGVDYRRNPWPQIAWGLEYIDKRYGNPCTAWKRFKRGGGY